MNLTWKKKIFSGYFLVALFLMGLCYLNDLMNWPIVTWIGLKQPINYGDANIILKAADCYLKIGTDVLLKSNEQCPYNYGLPLLQFLNVFRLGEEQTYLIALFFIFFIILSFIGILSHLQFKVTFNFLFFAFCLFFCPPIILLLERANFDALIFSLICITIFLRLHKRNLLAILITSLTVLFKFYTFPALVYLFFIEKIVRNKIIAFLLVILCAFSVLKDLQQIKDGFSIPNPMVFSFGVSKFIYMVNESIGLESSRLAATFGGLGFFILILGIFSKTSTLFPSLQKMNQEWKKLSENQIFVLKFLFIIHLSVYLTGMSYVYRLIFIFPLIVFLNTLAAVGFKLLARMGFLGFLFSFPFPPNRGLIFGGMEPIGDVCILLITVVLTWLFLSNMVLLRSQIIFGKILN